MNKISRVRYAVVGLGHIAQNAVLPAFKKAKASELVALVSDDPRKLKLLGKQYRVDLLFGYDRYDELLQSGEIDAVYVAVPNHLHRDFTLRATNSGIHVLCEKPLALDSAECMEMITSAERSRVKLMTAYRLHFEKSNLAAIDLINKKKIGDAKYFISSFSFPPPKGNIRTQLRTGGGPLFDIGTYCINAARYLFQSEPEAVMAMQTFGSRDRLEKGVEETVAVLLRFPGDRIANFTISFGSAATSTYQVVGTKGDLCADNPYDYAEPTTHELTIRGKTRKTVYKPGDQFAPELEYFAKCILEDREPEPSGWEGLADIRVMEAIRESAKSGRSVTLAPFEKRQRPGLRQKISKPSHGKPRLVAVQEPKKKAA
jgi:predicted dehydrogenase